MTTASESAGPIKVGVITDQSGPLSFMGIANANVARMVIDDINANGGLLGRQIDLYLEDSATIDSVAEAKAIKLVQLDEVDVMLGLVPRALELGEQMCAGGIDEERIRRKEGRHGETFALRRFLLHLSVDRKNDREIDGTRGSLR